MLNPELILRSPTKYRSLQPIVVNGSTPPNPKNKFFKKTKVLLDSLIKLIGKILQVKVPLITEIHFNKLEDVKFFISQNSQNLNFFYLYSNDSYVYPLVYSVWLHRYEIVKLLLKHGSDPNFLVKPVHGVYSDPKERYIYNIIMNKKQVISEEGWILTPTTTAFINGHFQILSLLYQHGGSIRNCYSLSLINYFLNSRKTLNKNICDVVIQYRDFDVTESENDQFQVLIEKKNKEIIDPVLKNHFNEIVKMLIEYGFTYKRNNVQFFTNNNKLIKILNLEKQYAIYVKKNLQKSLLIQKQLSRKKVKVEKGNYNLKNYKFSRRNTMGIDFVNKVRKLKNGINGGVNSRAKSNQKRRKSSVCINVLKKSNKRAASTSKRNRDRNRENNSYFYKMKRKKLSKKRYFDRSEKELKRRKRREERRKIENEKQIKKMMKRIKFLEKESSLLLNDMSNKKSKIITEENRRKQSI